MRDLPENVVELRPSSAIAEAWREYERLVHAANEDRRLLADLDHQIATIRAHRRWADLFLASDHAA